MTLIAIEEHWTNASLDQALRSQPIGRRDESLALNSHGDAAERLLELGHERIAAMDAAGVDIQVVSLAPPGTVGLPPAEAIALAREANDQVAAAVRAFPTRLRALSALPLTDPAASVTELERTATLDGHVGVMTYGRSLDRPLDDPAYDDLWATAARLGRPVFIHPQLPPAGVRAASYSGLGSADLELALATFGWGWHLEAGLAALRLILRGTLDRHPQLQLVLGHWGEGLLGMIDRADSLARFAGLRQPISAYVRSNVHITCSGMMNPRLLRHTLDVTTVGRILLSGDTPFQSFDAAAAEALLAALPDAASRQLIAAGNATALFHLAELEPSDHTSNKEPS